jgi:hypothetical protein
MRRVRDRMSAAFRLTCSITGYAIASSEEAFDADANAGAAAWIPGCGRFAAGVGTERSQPTIRRSRCSMQSTCGTSAPSGRESWGTHRGASDLLPATYAVLLSPQARLVRVVTPLDPSPEQPARPARPMPTDKLGETVQWLHQLTANLRAS